MNQFAKTLRKEATAPERLLWSRLRSRQFGGFRFRRQRPIGPYICDFVCLSENVIVELDGGQHVEQSEYDNHRDSFLRTGGYRVLRFWNGDVVERLDTVLGAAVRIFLVERQGFWFDELFSVYFARADLPTLLYGIALEGTKLPLFYLIPK